LELDDLIMGVIKFTFQSSCATTRGCWQGVDVSFEVASCGEAHTWSLGNCQIEVHLFLGLGKGLEAAESVGGLGSLAI